MGQEQLQRKDIAGLMAELHAEIDEMQDALRWLVRADYCRRMLIQADLGSDDASCWHRECAEAVKEAGRLRCVAEIVKTYTHSDEKAGQK